MKHTKGPWKVDEKTEYTISVHAPWSDRVKVVEEQTFGDYRGALICEMHYNTGVPTKEKALANAKLIAAATDLLEALQKAVNYANQPNNPKYHFWINDALTALVKAQ